MNLNHPLVSLILVFSIMALGAFFVWDSFYRIPVNTDTFSGMTGKLSPSTSPVGPAGGLTPEAAPGASIGDIATDVIQVDDDDPLLSASESILPEDEEVLLMGEATPTAPSNLSAPLIVSSSAAPLTPEKPPSR